MTARAVEPWEAQSAAFRWQPGDTIADYVPRDLHCSRADQVAAGGQGSLPSPPATCQHPRCSDGIHWTGQTEPDTGAWAEEGYCPVAT